MASEVISHAIFASFHLTPPRTASSSTPPSTPRFAPPRAALRLSLCPSHYLPPCTPTLHPIMRFTQHLDPHSHPYPSAKSLLPPAHPFPIRVSPSLSVPQPSPFTPYFTPHPIMPSALTPISHPRLSTLRVPQPSPFTPYFTPHPIMPFTLRTDPIPHHPFPIRVSPSLPVPQPSPACGFSRA